MSEAVRLLHAKSWTCFPSTANADFWLIDRSRAKAPQSNAGPFTAQDLRKEELRGHLTVSLTHTSFFGLCSFTKGDFIAASLRCTSKHPLDHTIMGKEDKHTPRCCKRRLASTSWGYRAPAEPLNATTLIYISAQQLDSQMFIHHLKAFYKCCSWYISLWPHTTRDAPDLSLALEF